MKLSVISEQSGEGLWANPASLLGSPVKDRRFLGSPLRGAESDFDTRKKVDERAAARSQL